MDFRADVRGHFMIVTASVALPLITIVGMSVDVQREMRAHNHAQDALDASVLHAMRHSNGLSLQEVEDLAKEIFMANITGAVALELENFSAMWKDNGNLAISVNGNIKPSIIQIAGFPNLQIDLKTQATAQSSNGMELVIAFDTTASMGFGNTWDAAVGTLENTLEDLSEYSGNSEFFVSLVPFSDRVNLGTSRTSFLDGVIPNGAPHWWDIAGDWNGCVEPREENITTGAGVNFPWALDNQTPAEKPFFVSIPNVTGGLANAWGGSPRCPSVALTGPTSNVNEVIAAAESLTKAGTGRFDVAMAWSWRLLSPAWEGQWGVDDYPALNSGDIDATERRKIAIYVTDGRTEAYTYELSQERNWGWNSGSEVGFEHMVHVCDQMKEDGIEIYMIRVNGNVHAEPYMQQCATDAAHYMTVSNNADLALAFTQIGIGVKSSLRIVK